VDLWGIRFHPWGAAPFLGFGASDLRDCLVPLGDVANSLEQAIRAAGEEPTDEAQLIAITGALSARVASARSIDHRLPALVAYGARADEPYTVRGLAREVGLSVRRVERLFADDIGLSPKQIHRIHRLQRALALRRVQPNLTWAAIAARVGYHDHAHLVHDARDIAGAPPSDILGSNGLTETFLAE